MDPQSSLSPVPVQCQSNASQIPQSISTPHRCQDLSYSYILSLYFTLIINILQVLDTSY